MVHLDDVTVFSKWHLHINHVKTTFQKITEYGYSLSSEKCRINFEEGTLLGHIIFIDGLRMDPKKSKVSKS